MGVLQMATSNLKKQILTSYAKSLRHNATQAEKVLWRHLRARQLEGIKFRRQQPIDGYIVDFVSFETRLFIELAGGQHAVNRQKDIKRDQCLIRNGFRVLRFWNHGVIGNLEGALEVIRKACLNCELLHFIHSSSFDTVFTFFKRTHLTRRRAS